MFSSNGTKPEEFKKAQELGAIINVDDISLLENLQNSGHDFPELICFRVNPGEKKTGNKIIGNPVDAKFGITLEQIIPAYKKAQELGAKRFGLHTMTGSNMLDENYFPETAQLLSDIANQLKDELGIALEFINIGGGFGIPYKPEEKDLNIHEIVEKIQKVFSHAFPDQQPKLFMEIGRWLTGPTGYLVSKVVSRKDIYKKYVVLDSSMADLMRTGMYNTYHHITVVSDNKNTEEVVDVVGSLCENNDKFAIDRTLPVSKPDDIIVIHDTGAHGRAMGFNYNGKLRTQEILIKTDGTPQRIRREETLNDYFATIQDFL